MTGNYRLIKNRANLFLGDEQDLRYRYLIASNTTSTGYSLKWLSP
ncbi:MAG: hypothetical protein ACLU4N_08240 [Butyricimonas faecihominis]